MTEVNLNPTVDGYRGSIGRLVFKRYKGRTIVAKKAIVTAEPTPAQLAQREQFKEASAFGKFAQADPELRAFYEPIARERELSVYTTAMTDFLTKPSIKPLDLSGYTGQVDDVILITATDDIGLARVHVSIFNQGTLVEHGDAVETGAGSGKWTYAVTASVSAGSNVSIEVAGIDHALNPANVTESLIVGQGN
jgi:hypothetical protein